MASSTKTHFGADFLSSVTYTDIAGPFFSTFMTPFAAPATGAAAASSYGVSSSTGVEVEGTDAGDVLTGSDGNDTLSGGDGDDSLSGGDGDDMLSGGTGADHHDGGEGSDFVDFRDIIGGGVGWNMLTGEAWGKAEGDTFASIENIWGSLYSDKFVGSEDKNVIYGGGGHDTIEGRGGDDQLYGCWGNDTLLGGDGDDVLNGGHYNDTYTGGAGADTFVFNQHQDVITDFNAAEGDRIMIDQWLWGGGEKTAAELIAQYATVDTDAGAIVFDFGYGHSLTLEGTTDLDALAAQLTSFVSTTYGKKSTGAWGDDVVPATPDPNPNGVVTGAWGTAPTPETGPDPDAPTQGAWGAAGTTDTPVDPAPEDSSDLSDTSIGSYGVVPDVLEEDTTATATTDLGAYGDFLL